MAMGHFTLGALEVHVIQHAGQIYYQTPRTDLEHRRNFRYVTVLNLLGLASGESKQSLRHKVSQEEVMEIFQNQKLSILQTRILSHRAAPAGRLGGSPQ